ncbi:MAG: SURF1 family protein [Rhodobacteraceae bacterium]|nr:SURF1 family protein [Paracoccaceae bacterium]
MTEDDPRRPLWVDATILISAFIVFVVMVGLGNWQMQRLAWKLDLIEAVETRAFAPEVPAPSGPVTEVSDEYTRVEATGTLDYAETRRVKAVTDLGLGFWLMTPLETPAKTIWVNRGFIPQNFDGVVQEPEGPQRVTGLLRFTEPEGTLLESNDAAADRWVARDIAVLSDVAGLTSEPYFIDADHLTAPGTFPRGGLTIVGFRNSHLSYALTWYAMALLFAAGMVYVIWDRVRARKRRPRLVYGE